MSLFNLNERLSEAFETTSIRPYLSPVLLKELRVYLLADDLGANIIFDGDAQPHLLQDKFHLLLLLHGSIRLHLSSDLVISTFI